MNGSLESMTRRHACNQHHLLGAHLNQHKPSPAPPSITQLSICFAIWILLPLPHSSSAFHNGHQQQQKISTPQIHIDLTASRMNGCVSESYSQSELCFFSRNVYFSVPQFFFAFITQFANQLSITADMPTVKNAYCMQIIGTGLMVIHYESLEIRAEVIRRLCPLRMYVAALKWTRVMFRGEPFLIAVLGLQHLLSGSQLYIIIYKGIL